MKYDGKISRCTARASVMVEPLPTRSSDVGQDPGNRLFLVSRRSVSSASVTGTPARRNVAI